MSWVNILKEDFVEEDIFGLMELAELIQKHYETKESVLPVEDVEEINKFVAKYMERLQ